MVARSRRPVLFGWRVRSPSMNPKPSAQLPDALYNCIYADPPWRFGDGTTDPRRAIEGVWRAPAGDRWLPVQVAALPPTASRQASYGPRLPAFGPADKPAASLRHEKRAVVRHLLRAEIGHSALHVLVRRLTAAAARHLLGQKLGFVHVRLTPKPHQSGAGLLVGLMCPRAPGERTALLRRRGVAYGACRP